MKEEICGEHAAFRYTWPGRDESFCCVEHAMGLMNVAGAIGLHLQLIPISYRASDPIPEQFPICQQTRPAAGTEAE